MPEINLCAECVLAVVNPVMPPPAFTPYPPRNGVEVELTFASYRTGQVFEMKSDQTTEFKSIDANDFLLIVNTLSSVPGEWNVDGMRTYPHLTVLFKGTALCVQHLTIAKGKETLNGS